MRSPTLLVVAALAGFGGCGGDVGGFSARDGCGEVWGSVCKRYYECFSPGQLEEGGLPPTVEQCQVQLKNEHCGGWGSTTCEGDLVYHGPALPDCQAELEALSCDAIEGGPGAAASCAAVCTAQ